MVLALLDDEDHEVLENACWGLANMTDQDNHDAGWVPVLMDQVYGKVLPLLR